MVNKFLEWLESRNVRRSETEVLQQEIDSLKKYNEEKTKELEANKEKLEMHHREYTLYEAYKEAIDEHNKAISDTF